MICLEHGLSVIKAVPPRERKKRTTYPERESFREKIRASIDEILQKKPKDLDAFLKLLQEEGYEVKHGKYIAVKGKEQKSYIRLCSLGAGYKEEDISRILLGEKKQNPMTEQRVFKPQEKKLDMLLNIQEIIAKGKGPGYERWAKLHGAEYIQKQADWRRI